MIVRKFNDVKEVPVTQLVYKNETLSMEGVTIRWLTHKGVGDANYKHNFAMRYFTVKHNCVIPAHNHEYVEGVFILTGRLKSYLVKRKLLLKLEICYMYLLGSHILLNVYQKKMLHLFAV